VVLSRVDIVLRGYTNLTAPEKDALIKKLNEYINSKPLQKSTFNERLGVVLGPLAGSCPCCGK
jgi:hypothetical protein